MARPRKLDGDLRHGIHCVFALHAHLVLVTKYRRNQDTCGVRALNPGLNPGASRALGELTLGEGDLPRRAKQLVLDWAELHQAELLEDWDLCQANQQPNPIDPLK